MLTCCLEYWPDGWHTRFPALQRTYHVLIGPSIFGASQIDRQDLIGVNIVVQQVKVTAVTPARHIGVPVQVLATLVPIQFPTNIPRKAVEDGSGSWLPTSHVES